MQCATEQYVAHNKKNKTLSDVISEISRTKAPCFTTVIDKTARFSHHLCLLQREGNKKNTYFLRMNTYHFFQGSTSSKRTSEMCEAVNK